MGLGRGRGPVSVGMVGVVTALGLAFGNVVQKATEDNKNVENPSKPTSECLLTWERENCRGRESRKPGECRVE